MRTWATPHEGRERREPEYYAETAGAADLRHERGEIQPPLSWRARPPPPPRTAAPARRAARHPASRPSSRTFRCPPGIHTQANARRFNRPGRGLRAPLPPGTRRSSRSCRGIVPPCTYHHALVVQHVERERPLPRHRSGGDQQDPDEGLAPPLISAPPHLGGSVRGPALTHGPAALASYRRGGNGRAGSIRADSAWRTSSRSWRGRYEAWACAAWASCLRRGGASALFGPQSRRVRYAPSASRSTAPSGPVGGCPRRWLIGGGARSACSAGRRAAPECRWR